MATEKLSPGVRQYVDIKSFCLFVIDFYELFYEDAVNAAQILEISLTSRNKNAENPIPIFGAVFLTTLATIYRCSSGAWLQGCYSWF